jgi:hypothetical protein
MQTVVEWFRKRERCFACNATGMTSNYGSGEGFLGPIECRSCNGVGAYWITPKGRHVEYPGGRFL